MDLVSPKNTAETCAALCVRHTNGHLVGRGHAVANSWRTGADICSYWSTDNAVNPYCHGVADIIQNNEQYSRYSAPFGWNDPCFLVTGKTPRPLLLLAETRRLEAKRPKAEQLLGSAGAKYMHGSRNLSLTEDQSIAQFSLWAMMASPLIMSIDVQQLTPFQLSVLVNTATCKRQWTSLAGCVFTPIWRRATRT